MMRRGLPSAGADLAELNALLEGAPVGPVLAWFWEASEGRVAATASFQTQSVPLLHLISVHVPEMPVLFLDTGFLFPETLLFRDLLADDLGLKVRVVTPRPDENDLVVEGKELYARDPDDCRKLRKVDPLDRALREYVGWVAGVRRDQAAHRATMQPLAWAKDGRLKLSPLLSWTAEDVPAYRLEHNLPEHPLAAGYPSIGCWPCTERVEEGKDPRSARRAGTDKTEYGLHS